MKQFKYPLCAINPNTEKPYNRHAWEIVEGGGLVAKNGRYFYRVRCKRKACQINDPHPVAF
jgi:hypothetical protein